eukprot:280299-Alexandrium_andersonii.AAC.1
MAKPAASKQVPVGWGHCLGRKHLAVVPGEHRQPVQVGVEVLGPEGVEARPLGLRLCQLPPEQARMPPRTRGRGKHLAGVWAEADRPWAGVQPSS